MHIKYIRAKNFLSIGKTQLEIDFTKYGNIIQIKGRNLDYGEDSSNGSGKSSLLEIAVYALYGKLIKGLNHKEAINIYSKGNLEVEIRFDDYRVIRRREPNELYLWQGDKDLTVGGMPATQAIINNIIGLSYESFTNVVCFGQHNEKGFLRCTAAEKRAVAENLLSLDKYVKFNKSATEKRKAIQEKANQIKTNYEVSSNNIFSATKRLSSFKLQQEQWESSKELEISKLTKKINENKNLLSLNKTVVDHAQEIKTVDNNIEQLEEQRVRIHKILETAESKIHQRKEERQELTLAISNQERQIRINLEDISVLDDQIKQSENQKGNKCPVCFGDVKDENIDSVVDYKKKLIQEKERKIAEFKSIQQDKRKQLESCDKNLESLVHARKDARDKETIYSAQLNDHMEKKTKLSKLQLSSSNLLIAKEIEHFENQLKAKQMDKPPFNNIIKTAEEELVSLTQQATKFKKELEEQQKILPYYEFWVRAFGDEGIRSFVISEITPVLNGKINYWLQFLLDNKIHISFDNQLEERIEKFHGGDSPFVYNSLSGGEHQRIDLAISFSFANIMTLTSGTCPSIIMLDEVGTNLDRPGVYAVYKTICELAKDRQVLITTHHPELQELLSPHDTIEVVMENGFTTIKN